MSELDQIREKYPDYKDWSDQKLSRALKKKYHPEMPDDEYYNQLGVDPNALTLMGQPYPVPEQEKQKEYSLNIFGEPEKFKNAIEWFTKSPSAVGLKKSVESVPLAMQQSVADAFDLPNYRKHIEKEIATNNKEYNQAYKNSPILATLGSITGDLPYAILAFETGAAGVSAATNPIVSRLTSMLQGQGGRIPAIANEGMQILQRIMQGGAGGGIHSAMQPIEEGGSRAENIGEGAESGALVSALLESLGLGGRALNAGFNQLRPSNMFRGNLTGEELAANLRAAEGTNTPLGDVIESPTLKKTFENISVPTPLSGGQDILAGTKKQVQQRAEQTVKNLVPKAVSGDPNEVAQSLLSDAYQTQRGIKNDLYNNVSDLAKKEKFQLELPSFSKIAQDTNAAIRKSALYQHDEKFKQVYNKLSNFEHPTKTSTTTKTGLLQDKAGKPLINETVTETTRPTIAEANFVASQLEHEGNKMIKGLSAGDRAAGDLYNRMANAIRSDVKGQVSSKGTPELKSAYEEATTNYRENFSDFLDKNAYKFLAPGYDAQSFVQEVIQPSKQYDKYTNIDRIQKLLPPGNENLMGFAYLRGALDKKGNLKPVELKTLINQLGNRQFKALFPNEATREGLMDYVRLAEMNPEALNVMFNARNGSRTAQTIISGLGTFAGGGALFSGHPVMAAASIITPIVGARVFNRWITSPGVRENIVRAMQQQPGNAIARAQRDNTMRQLQRTLLDSYRESEPKSDKKKESKK